jgi:acid phosphatase (class A)
MQRRNLLPLIFGVLLAMAPIYAAGPAVHFLASGAIDAKAVLPAPPEPGSLAARADLETVLQVQASRTPAEVAWARFIVKDQPFYYVNVLGPWFTKENLPATAAFLQAVTGDLAAVSNGAKDLFARPRPPYVDAAVHPCVEIPASASYPSGHTMRAFVWAAVLGEIFPDRQVELSAWAHQVAWGRVMGGVHFPTDLMGGRILAEAVVEALRKNPAYRADIEKCRAEVAPFLLKKAA